MTTNEMKTLERMFKGKNTVVYKLNKLEGNLIEIDVKDETAWIMDYSSEEDVELDLNKVKFSNFKIS